MQRFSGREGNLLPNVCSPVTIEHSALTTRPSAEAPRPNVSSLKWEYPSEPGKPEVPPQYPTFRRPPKHTHNRREKSGTGALDKHPGDGTIDGPTEPEAVGDQDPAPVYVGKERSGSKRIFLFGSAANRYKSVIRWSTPSREGSGAVSETPESPGTESLGDPPSSFTSRANLPRKQRTQSGSSSADWRKGDEPRFTDKSAESTRNPRRTNAPPRARERRSGSISEGHTSEGHQSPEDDGESKKKVDWY